MITDKALANLERAIKTPATRTVYLHRTNEFRLFLKADSFSKILKRKQRPLENGIVAYIDYLKARNLSAKTINLALSAVRLFFIANRTALDWDWIRTNAPAVDKIHEDRLYTKDELNAIYEKCDERKRVMFLILYSTGIRIGALPNMKIGDLKKIEQYGIYQINVYSGTKSRYIVFTTPECCHAIDGYLSFRKSRGENILPESPLIRKQFNKDKPNDVQPMTLDAIIAVLDDLVYDAGVRVKGERFKRKSVMRFHAWRKATNTAMITAGVKPVVKELLLGHKVGLENSYYRPSIDELMNEYVKAIPYLTISDAPALKVEVDKLRLETENVEGLRAELKDIRARLDRYERKDKESADWFKATG